MWSRQNNGNLSWVTQLLHFIQWHTNIFQFSGNTDSLLKNNQRYKGWGSSHIAGVDVYIQDSTTHTRTTPQRDAL